MKIQGTNPVEGQDVYNRVKDINKNHDTEQRDNANKADDSRDRITLSGKAKEINELKSLINQMPEIRTDRIESIKKAIDAGTYNVDLLNVAKKILEEI